MTESHEKGHDQALSMQQLSGLSEALAHLSPEVLGSVLTTLHLQDDLNQAEMGEPPEQTLPDQYIPSPET